MERRPDATVCREAGWEGRLDRRPGVAVGREAGWETGAQEQDVREAAPAYLVVGRVPEGQVRNEHAEARYGEGGLGHGMACGSTQTRRVTHSALSHEATFPDVTRPGRNAALFDHHAAPLPSTTPLPASAMLLPPRKSRHGTEPGHLDESLLNRSSPSTISAKLEALEGTLRANVRNLQGAHALGLCGRPVAGTFASLALRTCIPTEEGQCPQRRTQ